MANPTLHWRMLPPVSVKPQADIASAVLDAIYTAGTSAFYADGTARTTGTWDPANLGQVPLTAGPTSLGTNSAWTWNYDATTFGTGKKTALYAYPPTTSSINALVCIAGASNVAGAAWKQLNTDIRQPNYIYVGQAKNTGFYQGWNNPATPFTVGDFTGFAGIAAAAQTLIVNYVIMWESEEALIVQMVYIAATAVQTAILGAYIDPLSTNTANAETDGRLYGVTMQGYTNYVNASWLNGPATTGGLFSTSATAGDAHSVTFTPGAGTLVNTTRFGGYSPSSSFLSRNGDMPQIPLPIWNGTQFLGQLRQMFIIRDGISGDALIQALNPGSATKGYIMSASAQGATDALLLTY